MKLKIYPPGDETFDVSQDARYLDRWFGVGSDEDGILGYFYSERDAKLFIAAKASEECGA